MIDCRNVSTGSVDGSQLGQGCINMRMLESVVWGGVWGGILLLISWVVIY